MLSESVPRLHSLKGTEQRSGWSAQHHCDVVLLQLHLSSVWEHGAATPVLHGEVLGRS